MLEIEKLVFVWNADFSVAGGIRALKEVASGEHSCTLCEIAYHRVTQTSEWKAYKKSLGIEVREPCRNQLKADQLAAAGGDFPCVLAHTEAGVHKLLGAKEIDACEGDFERFRHGLGLALAAL
ncbi:MAG: hypothetical protein OXT49_00540 [Gammaproteobacteria bacterium]|nr:hypothetical protein [Gammaproteobacteria bacterium]